MIKRDKSPQSEVRIIIPLKVIELPNKIDCFCPVFEENGIFLVSKFTGILGAVYGYEKLPIHCY